MIRTLNSSISSFDHPLTVLAAPRLVSARISSRNKWIGLVTLIAFYLALYFYYYPLTNGVEDETGFINQAIVWSKGAISAEGARLPHVGDFIESKGRHVAWRNPGRSLLILPLLYFGWKSVYISGALIHALLALTAGAILYRLGRPPRWAALVLFHPTLALYSRTIMGDAPAALALLLALYAAIFSSRPGWWAGAWIGVAALMRYQAGICLPGFALALAYAHPSPRRRTEALHCLIAAGMAGALIATYNVYLYGSPAGWTYQDFFGASFLADNLKFYVPALCLLWPLMLFAPLADRSSVRFYACGICGPVFLLCCFYYFHDGGTSWLRTLVLGQRLISIVLPVWILSYALVLDRWVAQPPRLRASALLKGAVAAGCAALAVAVACAFYLHDRHLQKLARGREEVFAMIPPDSLVLANTRLVQISGIADPNFPAYRWRLYHFKGVPWDHAAELNVEHRRWFIALLPRYPGDELPDVLAAYIRRYHMRKPPTSGSDLILYAAEGAR
jgi:hypothetical protein